MVTVYKAQPLPGRGQADVPDLYLRATEPFPAGFDPTSAALRHDYDARRVFESLRSSLPGGTFDAVLRHMLEHRASQLVVVAPVKRGIGNGGNKGTDKDCG